MGSATVALLTFNRNDSRATVELVRRLTGHVDEVVVIDSSEEAGWTDLLGGLRFPRERAVRSIPTGYADLLQPLGVAEVSSEWVFYCDPDEDPSPGLLGRLEHLDGADAFVVPRWERAVGAYTPHLRLFRKAAFLPPDPAYAFPTIRGTTRKLPRSERLVHRRDYRSALEGDYATRVMDLESFERPVDNRWIRSVLSGSIGRRADPTPGHRVHQRERPVSEPAAALAAGLISIRELAKSGSPAWAKFQWRYHRARAWFQNQLPLDERRRREEVVRANACQRGSHPVSGVRPTRVRSNPLCGLYLGHGRDRRASSAHRLSSRPRVSDADVAPVSR